MKKKCFCVHISSYLISFGSKITKTGNFIAVVIKILNFMSQIWIFPEPHDKYAVTHRKNIILIQNFQETLLKYKY